MDGLPVPFVHRLEEALAQAVELRHDARIGGFFVVIGKGAEGRRVPFHIYHWDGKERARRLADLAFERGPKPEGVCVGTIGGRIAGVIADDAGGYAVIWNDDPRLQALIGSAPEP